MAISQDNLQEIMWKVERVEMVLNEAIDMMNARVIWAFYPTPEEYEERLRVMGVI